MSEQNTGTDLNDEIYGTVGADELSGLGGDDFIFGDAGGDYIDGGAGADTLEGGAGQDSLWGGDGADSLSGGADGDTLNGGSGDDTLDGGEGDDSLWGDGGSDTFTLSENGGQDYVYGGEDSDNLDQDTLDLSGTTGGAVQFNGWDFGFVDVYGGSQVQFWEIENVIGGSDADFIDARASAADHEFSGMDGDDLILGGSGTSVLDGGSGNDWLEAHGREATLSGGDGDDFLLVDNGDATLTGGAGDDTFTLEITNNGDGTYEGFGNVVITDFAAGTGEDNYEGLSINYYGLPAETFQGVTTDGADSILTFAYGDGQVSTVRLQNYIFDEYKLYVSTDSLSLQADIDDRVITTEGTEGADTLEAGDGPSVVRGLGGDDTIYGGAGNDSLYGGDGADFLYDGLGNDEIQGGAGNDSMAFGYDAFNRATVSEVDEENIASGGDGDDEFLHFAGDSTLTGGDGDDYYQFNIADRGDGRFSAFGDVVITDFGVGASGWMTEVIEVLNWGSSESTLQGISMDGDDSILTFSYGGGLESTIRLKNYHLNEWDVDDYNGTLTVNADPLMQISHDLHHGTDAGDTIDGGAGDDTIYGYAGDDYLYGSNGNDVIDGGDGDDRINDWDGVNDISAGAGNDTIEVWDGVNTIDAGTGDDSISVEKGDATISAGAGDDTISLQVYTSGNGDVTAFGNIVITDFAQGVTPYALDERLYINLGSDQVDAFQGMQIEGDDSVLNFTFSDGQTGSVRLVGYHLNEWDASVSEYGQITLYADPLRIVSDDLLEGTEEADQLDGGIGNDTLIGRGGDDYLNGGEGDDVVDGGAGDDYIDDWDGVNDVTGGSGNDTIQLWDGVNTVDAGEGADEVRIESGDATISAGAGDDTISVSVYTSENGDVTAFGNIVVTDFAQGVEPHALDERIYINLGSAQVEAFQGMQIEGDDSVLTFAFSDGQTGSVRLVGYHLSEWDASVSEYGQITLYADPLRIVSDDLLEGTVEADGLQGGVGNDTVIGNEGDDFLNGGDGDDLVDGGAGDDMIDSHAGSNTLSGGAGEDMFYVTGGQNTISGGEGEDFFQFNIWDRGDGTYDGFGDAIITDFGVAGGRWDSDSIAVDNGSARFAGVTREGNDSILTFDLGDGTTSTIRLKDYLLDEGAVQTQYTQLHLDSDPLSRVSDDLVQGTEGPDFLEGGAGNDTLDGLGGDDVLLGGVDDDILLGGAGDDTLDGGEGADTLTGGAGDDTFAFTIAEDEDGAITGFGDVTITDFGARNGDDVANDRLQVSYAGLTAAPERSLVIDGRDTLITFTYGDGQSSSIRLVDYHADEEEITLDEYGLDLGSDDLDRVSDDEIVGTDGDDVEYGGAGDDRFEGGGGNDTFVGGEGEDTYLLAPGSGETRVIDDGGAIEVDADIEGDMLSMILYVVDGVQELHIELLDENGDPTGDKIIIEGFTQTPESTGGSINIKNWQWASDLLQGLDFGFIPSKTEIDFKGIVDRTEGAAKEEVVVSKDTGPEIRIADFGSDDIRLMRDADSPEDLIVFVRDSNVSVRVEDQFDAGGTTIPAVEGISFYQDDPLYLTSDLHLEGTKADDTVMGTAGVDTLIGAGGDDVFIGRTHEIDGDTIKDISGLDAIEVSDLTFDRNAVMISETGALTVDVDGDGDYELQMDLDGWAGNTFNVTNAEGGGSRIEFISLPPEVVGTPITVVGGAMVGIDRLFNIDDPDGTADIETIEVRFDFSGIDTSLETYNARIESLGLSQAEVDAYADFIASENWEGLSSNHGLISTDTFSMSLDEFDDFIVQNFGEWQSPGQWSWEPELSNPLSLVPSIDYFGQLFSGSIGVSVNVIDRSGLESGWVSSELFTDEQRSSTDQEQNADDTKNGITLLTNFSKIYNPLGKITDVSWAGAALYDWNKLNNDNGDMTDREVFAKEYALNKDILGGLLSYPTKVPAFLVAIGAWMQFLKDVGAYEFVGNLIYELTYNESPKYYTDINDNVAGNPAMQGNKDAVIDVDSEDVVWSMPEDADRLVVTGASPYEIEETEEGYIVTVERSGVPISITVETDGDVVEVPSLDEYLAFRTYEMLIRPLLEGESEVGGTMDGRESVFETSVVVGSAEDDLISVGGDQTQVFGGDGADTFILEGGAMSRTILDFNLEEGDRLVIETDTGRLLIDEQAELDALAAADDVFVFEASDGSGDLYIDLPDSLPAEMFDLDQAFEGTMSDDIALGAAGDDTFAAGGGSDQFIGEYGADAMLIDAADTAEADSFRFIDLNFEEGDSITLTGFGTDMVIDDAEALQELIDAGYATSTAWEDGSGDLDVTLTGLDPTLSGIDQTIRGTEGDDELDGTGDIDTIEAGAGDDRVFSYSGSDYVSLGDGNDYAYGAVGNDTLLGGNGNDTLNGGNNNDLLDGGEGDDLVMGGPGLDMMFGGAGNDSLHGGLGADTMDGGAGNDTLDGAAHADMISGGAGDDVILTGADDDVAYGGEGSDRMVIGAADGSDALYGGENADNVDIDVLDFAQNQEAVQVTLAGWEYGSYQVGSEGSSGTFYEFEGVTGGAAGDLIDARESGSDHVLKGMAGADDLRGGSGADALFGGDGDDLLLGGAGSDVLTGGQGADTFQFAHAEGAQQDIVTDFESGLDTIAIENADMFSLSFEETEDGVLATYGLDRSVLLEGLDSSQVSMNDFLFT